MKHRLTWTAAAPLWDNALADPSVSPVRFRSPGLLRFATDTFIQDLAKTLRSAPNRLDEYALRSEAWDKPAAGWQAWDELRASDVPKLYHPAHQRFYLVAANLVCHAPGLPDHAVDVAAGERAYFVVRRWRAKPGQRIDLTDPAQTHTRVREYAWIGDQQAGRWVEALQPDTPVVGEHRMPLFSMAFEHEGLRRRMLAGTIPAAAHDVYLGAPRADRRTPTSIELASGNPQLSAFYPIAEALESHATVLLEPHLAEAGADLLIALVLQLATFLEAELEAVWQALVGQAGTNGLTVGERALYDFLRGGSPKVADLLTVASERRSAIDRFGIDDAVRQAVFNATSLPRVETRRIAQQLWQRSGRTLKQYVVDAIGDPIRSAYRKHLLGTRSPFAEVANASDDAGATRHLLIAALELAERLESDLPDVWHAIAGGDPSPLSGAGRVLYDTLGNRSIAGLLWREFLAEVGKKRAHILTGDRTCELSIVRAKLGRSEIAYGIAALATNSLVEAVVAASAERSVDVVAVSANDPDPAPDAHYVVRCVYERPSCAPFHSPLVSAPSLPFRLASFFDPEAPTRPIQIRMPYDTSINGFRRAAKGFSIVLSKKLRTQVDQAERTDADKLMEGELEPPNGFSVGMICSLSIPIVTICALILLMIIVNLLNILFRWLPYFIQCIPIFKGRNAS